MPNALNFDPQKPSVPRSSHAQYMGMKKLWTITKLYQRRELIASQYFETQLLNRLLQFFYKDNIAEYHYLGVLIIG